jgi:dihydrofolate synthase/folylpolyglutamate synthase
VNIVDCDIAVITAIDIDHQHWLGDTVEKIAPEKAAVARRGRPVILAESHYPETLFQTLRDIGALALHAGEHWAWAAENSAAGVTLRFSGSSSSGVFPIPAGLRPGNVAAALQACHHLLGRDFDAGQTAAALRALQVPGRRQRVLIEGREVLFDVAHNPAAMAALAEYLRDHPISGQTFAALGVMADKDLVSMAAYLATAVDGACALAIPGIDRAQSPEVIWQILDDAGVAIPQAEFTSETVWRQLREGSHAGDRIVICGSFHSVAGIMAQLKLELPVTTSQAGQTRG